MGRKPTYTVHDYADRVLAYINIVSKASTEDILDHVTGTNHRLFEGMVLLAAKKKINLDFNEDLTQIVWKAKAEEDEGITEVLTKSKEIK